MVRVSAAWVAVARGADIRVLVAGNLRRLPAPASLLRFRPEQYEHPPDCLDARSAELLGDPPEHRFAFFAFGSAGADLDQAVGNERAVDFLERGVAQSGCAQQNHGLECVRLRSQMQDLFLGKGKFAGSCFGHAPMVPHAGDC